jgi:hypothetical protein
MKYGKYPENPAKARKSSGTRHRISQKGFPLLPVNQCTGSDRNNTNISESRKTW